MSEEGDPPPGEIAAFWARGRAAFPELDVADEALARHLARLTAGNRRFSLEALAVEDLYLACACLSGVRGAVEWVQARYGETIRHAIGRIARGIDAGEIEQQLLKDLLVGSPAAGPKIALYAGRAPLDRWLQVAAQRAALGWVRERRTEARVQGALARESAARGSDPELEYLKDKYRGEIEAALKEALERATERDRALLRLHLVGGLTVEKIGRMFGVSQPTASRWLANARERLLENVKANLAGRIGASTEEIASLARLVASRLDLSLSQLLETGGKT